MAIELMNTENTAAERTQKRPRMQHVWRFATGLPLMGVGFAGLVLPGIPGWGFLFCSLLVLAPVWPRAERWLARVEGWLPQSLRGERGRKILVVEAVSVTVLAMAVTAFLIR